MRLSYYGDKTYESALITWLQEEDLCVQREPGLHLRDPEAVLIVTSGNAPAFWNGVAKALGRFQRLWPHIRITVELQEGDPPTVEIDLGGTWASHGP